MPDSNLEILPYGDSAFLIQFRVNGFSRQICARIHSLQKLFQSSRKWIDVVGAYDSLLLRFNPGHIDPIQAEAEIRNTLASEKSSQPKPGRLVEIPVYYGGKYGPDMDVIKASSGLTEADIIERHSAAEYLVCMMGFIPGFAFLSETDAALHHPRRETPRTHVPAGSVGIAGWQTGIYGLESPGGWQIIGQTPVIMFEKNRPEPFLVKAGDRIRFVPAKAGS